MFVESVPIRWTNNKWGLPNNYQFDGREIVENGVIVCKRRGDEIVDVNEQPEKGRALVTISTFDGKRGIVLDLIPEKTGVGLALAKACSWVEKKLF